MLLKGEQLAAHLERGLRPLYVLYGDEPLLVIEAADAIRAQGAPAGLQRARSTDRPAHFDWNQLLAAGGNLSLFGDRKLIDLRIPTGKPGKEGGAALQQWCRNLSPDTCCWSPCRNSTGARRSRLVHALVNAGVAIKLMAPPLAELPGWIAGRLRRQQQSAGSKAWFIAERVEGNLLAAHQEIQKLGLLYPAGALSLAQIRGAVLNVARYDIDGLREALLAGDVGRLTPHARRPDA
jgi:DNA polymerase-3 subunit delta